MLFVCVCIKIVQQNQAETERSFALIQRQLESLISKVDTIASTTTEHPLNTTRLIPDECSEDNDTLSNCTLDIPTPTMEPAPIFADCAEVYRSGHRSSGIYNIQIIVGGPVRAYCDMSVSSY